MPPQANGFLRRRLQTYLTMMALPGTGRVGLGRWLSASGMACLDQDPAVLLGQIKATLFPDSYGLAHAGQEALVRLNAMDRLGVTPVSRGGAGYPQGLELLPDPPPFLFIQGDLRAEPYPPVAIVGTREPSAWGLGEARRFSESAVQAGLCVLNGLARGIDQAALESTLDAGGRCCAVLACGHDLVDLSPAGPLARRILANGGILVSEYAPGIAAHKGSFIERDRIQAALSLAVVVVESGARGGTMHTARAALQAGVPLMALLPPNEEHAGGPEKRPGAPRPEGAKHLIGAGALHLRSTDQFLEKLSELRAVRGPRP